jgi:orotidine-5'-phosphate decarboxylase
VLAPGLGAQGGRAEDLATVFAGLRGLVLPASSREILARGPAVGDLRAAAEASIAACRNVLKLAHL